MSEERDGAKRPLMSKVDKFFLVAGLMGLVLTLVGGFAGINWLALSGFGVVFVAGSWFALI